MSNKFKVGQIICVRKDNGYIIYKIISIDNSSHTEYKCCAKFVSAAINISVKVIDTNIHQVCVGMINKIESTNGLLPDYMKIIYDPDENDKPKKKYSYDEISNATYILRNMIENFIRNNANHSSITFNCDDYNGNIRDCVEIGDRFYQSKFGCVILDDSHIYNGTIAKYAALCKAMGEPVPSWIKLKECK